MADWASQNTAAFVGKVSLGMGDHVVYEFLFDLDQSVNSKKRGNKIKPACVMKDKA
jgi:hypothetical protein